MAEKRAAATKRTNLAGNRTPDAFPDRIDLRDWAYQPTPVPLPDEIVNSQRVPIILDQGRQGACTGFALALVGYTRERFVVQNSWGTRWGSGGFALLPYEDCMKNARDLMLELTAAPIGGPMRSEMKENAWRASDHRRGIGAIQLMKKYALASFSQASEAERRQCPRPRPRPTAVSTTIPTA